MITTLHPQAAAHLAATTGPELSTLTVRDVRESLRGYLQLQRPLPAMADVEHRFIPGPTADLPIRILRPTRQPGLRPAVIILHGSGWVACNLDIVEEPARVLAVDTGFTTITVNYQKAPEHPFPIPLDDSVAAVAWVVAHAAELSIDADRIAIVGDSAGGNLAAAATAQLAAMGISIAAQALLYPALDRCADTPSYQDFATGFGLTAADMLWFWNHYDGQGTHDDARLSPRLNTALSASPPTLIVTAGHDVLRDEGEAYATALAAAGVDVEHAPFPGMIHGFWWMDAVLDDARVVQQRLADFLTSRLTVSS